MTAEAAAERPTPRLPNAIAFILAVGVVWLAGQFVTQGVSDQFQDSHPGWAVLWRADSPDAFSKLARENLLEQHYAAAVRLSARSLQLSPLSAPTLATYAIAMGHLGRHGVADRAIALAGQRSWRDVLTQVWLFRRMLELNRLPEAFMHADAAMRRSDDVPQIAFQAMAAAAEDPDSTAPLASRLALNPTWRLPFLTFLSTGAKPPVTGPQFAIMQALAHTAAPATEMEFGLLLRALVVEGKYQEALQDWRTLTHAPANTSTYVNDGDFTKPPGFSPFGWFIMSGVGWTAGIGDNPMGPGKALKVEYDGFAQPQPLGQMLVLNPGTYRLTGQWFDQNGVGAQTLKWTVTCPPTSGTVPGEQIGKTEMAAGSPGKWRDFSAVFTVPASNCPAEWLGLGADIGDISTDIAVWYRHLAITPIVASPPEAGLPTTH